MKGMMNSIEVKNIDWADTNGMLADTLTKRGGSSSWIRAVISENML